MSVVEDSSPCEPSRGDVRRPHRLNVHTGSELQSVPNRGDALRNHSPAGSAASSVGSCVSKKSAVQRARRSRGSCGRQPPAASCFAEAPRDCVSRSRSPRRGFGSHGRRASSRGTTQCETDRGQDDRPRALFLMGLPGAGKTTIKRQRLRKLDVDIEPDRFKRRHPRFSNDMGDETDEEVHRWSVRRAVESFEDTVDSISRPDVVLDSSGSNAQWLRRRIERARRRGYRTEILWVDAPVEIALLRNRDRAARRCERTMVPDKVIMDKVSSIVASFRELSQEVDQAETCKNWSERNGELERAQLDLYLYPPPRTRPPGLRPGERHYGEAPSGARAPSPTRGSRRTLRIGPWKRSDDVMREKNKRLEWMDRTYKGNREKYVLENVLSMGDIVLEPNMFPYQMPPDVVHWTIWSIKDLSHNELCEYIERWLDAREPHDVVSWNYDDNHGRRTIDLWHVHVYFRGRNGMKPCVKRSSPNDFDCKKVGSWCRSSRSPCSV